MNPLETLDLEQLRARTSVKWRTYPADVLPLWVAEMDVPLAPPVAAALTDAIHIGDTGYPCGTGYAEALQHFAATRWGWPDLPVGRSALVPDVMLGIVEVLKLITDPGDTVIVTNPVYAPFYAFVTHSGRTIAEVPLTTSGRLDLAQIEEAFRDARRRQRTVAALIANPHNPTGTVHTRAELAAVAALASEYGVRVIADEIHAPLVLDGAQFTPYLSVPGSKDGFALMSASKGWNLAGLKAAVLLAGSRAAGDLARLPEEVGHGASHLAVIAHSAAFRDGQPWLDDLLSGLSANRDLLGRLLANHLPAVGYRAPEGTYLAWLDCRALGFGDDAPVSSGPVSSWPATVTEVSGPASFFLERAKVALSSGHIFGSGAAGHARLNFACSATTLTTAIEQMGAASQLLSGDHQHSSY